MTLQYWKHWHKTWLFISIYLSIEPFIITFKCYDRNNYQWSYIAMKKHLIGIKIRIISLYTLKTISYSIFCNGEDYVFIEGKTSLSKEILMLLFMLVLWSFFNNRLLHKIYVFAFSLWMISSIQKKATICYDKTYHTHI